MGNGNIEAALLFADGKDQSNSIASGPIIPPVTVMPTAEPAAALTWSIFALSFSSSLQIVMVRNVFSPVTVTRKLVAHALSSKARNL